MSTVKTPSRPATSAFEQLTPLTKWLVPASRTGGKKEPEKARPRRVSNRLASKALQPLVNVPSLRLSPVLDASDLEPDHEPEDESVLSSKAKGKRSVLPGTVLDDEEAGI